MPIHDLPVQVQAGPTWSGLGLSPQRECAERSRVPKSGAESPQKCLPQQMFQDQ
jgi:hypothetical protein